MKVALDHIVVPALDEAQERAGLVVSHAYREYGQEPRAATSAPTGVRSHSPSWRGRWPR